MSLTQIPASMMDTGTHNLVLQQVRYQTGAMATGENLRRGNAFLYNYN